MDNLKLFAKHLMEAEKYLKQSIQNKDGEMIRLEAFEDNFRLMKENYSKFKELTDRSDKTTKELKSCLQKENSQHRKTIDQMTSQISNLRKMTEESLAENRKLELEYSESIKLFQHYKNGQANGISSNGGGSSKDNSFNGYSINNDSYSNNNYHNLSIISSSRSRPTYMNHSTTSPIASSSPLPGHLPTSMSSLTSSSATPVSNRNSSSTNCKLMMH